MTILVLKSPPTQNFPVIKSPPKSKSCIYLYFIPPPQPADAIPKIAALTMACVIGTQIGSDGAKLLIEVFDSHPKLQSLCGISPGSTTVDLSKSNMGPADCLILTHELQAGRATAAVNSLTLDSNGIFGELYPSGNVKQADKFVVEVQPLLDALKTSSITSLSLRSTGMGVKGVVAVADAIRAMASVASLTISGATTLITR